MNTSLFKFRHCTLTSPIALAVCAAICTSYSPAAFSEFPALTKAGSNFKYVDNGRSSNIAIDADGDFVVLWTTNKLTSNHNIRGQRYHADGSKSGALLKLTSGENHKHSTDIAMDDKGDFVIVWLEQYSVYARRYIVNGSPIGNKFRVGVDIIDRRSSTPKVTMDTDGDFIVSWLSSKVGSLYSGQIRAQRYKEDGTLVGSEFIANENFGYEAIYTMDIASNAIGDLTVVWSSHLLGEDRENTIYMKSYSADASIISNLIKVNDDSIRNEKPRIAMDSDGDFVVAWEAYDAVRSYPRANRNIYAQRFNADGTKSGEDFITHEDRSEKQLNPRVAMDDDGDFVVIWDGKNGGGYEVYMQRYNASGEAIGEQTRVNKKKSDGIYNIHGVNVVMDADGDFVVAWGRQHDYESEYKKYAQRYGDTGDAGGGGSSSGSLDWLALILLLPFGLRRTRSNIL